MKKKLVITAEIECGELTCIDKDTGDACDYLIEDFTGRCCYFFKVDLELTNDNNSLRCDKCKEAEQ